MDRLFVTKFCFCLNLKTGAFIVGYSSLLFNCIIMIAESIHFNTSSGGSAALASFITLMTITLTSIAFNVILLYGIYTNNRKFVLVNLWYRLVKLVLEVMALVTYPFFGATLIMIPIFISYMTSLYFALIVRSYAIEMRELEEHSPGKPRVHSSAYMVAKAGAQPESSQRTRRPRVVTTASPNTRNTISSPDMPAVATLIIPATRTN